MSKDLNPVKALIFRIMHRENLKTMLEKGICCRSSKTDPKYVEIGNPELIVRRNDRAVPIPPGGTLSDYVPFYFTPYTPMLYNILTGYSGITKRPAADIIILASSLKKLKEKGVTFVFSDRHAYLKTALFSSDLADLNRIDWPTLQDRNFKKDNIDRFERYQAEGLVHKQVPFDALLGAICYNDSVKTSVEAEFKSKNIELKIVAEAKWYL